MTSMKYTLTIDAESLRFYHHIPLVRWTKEDDRECMEALEKVMIQLQKPDSQYEAIVEDSLLPDADEKP